MNLRVFLFIQDGGFRMVTILLSQVAAVCTFGMSII